MTAASLPPAGLPGLEPRWSRLVRVVDADGRERTWHVLDSAAGAARSGVGTGVVDGSGAADRDSTEVVGSGAADRDSTEVVDPAGAADAGTVLCVHGNPTWSYAFRRVLADPPAGWRAVAVDHLDMGYSERTGTDRPLTRRIDDLGRLTDALELDGPVVLLAHDWGGPIALGWALAHRDQVAGLVLTNTAVHQPADAAAPPLIRSARARGVLETATVRTPTFLRGATALAGSDVPAEVRRAYAAPYATPARRAAIAAFVRDIPLETTHPSATTLDGIADRLDELAEVPALLLWGPSDPVFSDRYLHDLEARLPQADVHRVEGASHLTPEDIDLADALRRWLPVRVADDQARRADEPGGAASARSADRGGVDAEAPEPGDDEAGSATRVDTTAEGWDDGSSGSSEHERAEADGGGRLWEAIAEPGRAATDAIVEPPLVVGGVPRRATFAELDADVRALAVGLRRHGVQPGDRVASLVPPGRELATLLYACWRLGAVVVVADAGLGPRGLTRALRSAAPDHLVGISRALAAATALRWPGRRIAAGEVPAALRRSSGAEASLAELIETGRAALDGAAPGSVLLPAVPDRDAEAAIAFTSGSTGPAKGVLYRHRQLEAQRDALRRTYRITDDDRLVAAFAPFALYGPALGITSMVPDMDVTEPASLTAAALADAVVAVRATMVFASPAALVNVARTSDGLTSTHRAALAHVRLLLSAGAPVPARLLRRLAAVVPNAEAHTPYGMTEVLPVADIDLVTIEAVGPGEGVCVGHPVPDVEVAISPLDADGAATGALTTEAEVVGEVCVRAAHVKDRYDRLALTELASSRDAGWHRSGDVGHLDADGRIWIEGRLAHLIRTADGVVTPVGIEQRVEDIAHVTMAAAVGVGPAGTQQVVVVVATDPAPGRPQLAPLSLVDRVRAVAGAEVAAVLAVPSLPVDIRHQSKIDRERVAQEAADRLAGRGLRRRGGHRHHASAGDGSGVLGGPKDPSGRAPGVARQPDGSVAAGVAEVAR